MGVKTSKLFRRNNHDLASIAPSVVSADTGDLSHPQLPSHAASDQAHIKPAAVLLVAAAPMVPACVNPIPALTAMNTAVLGAKDLLVATRNASNMFASLEIALGHFLGVWNVYERTVEVGNEFIELVSKLSALKTMVTLNESPDDANLRKRMEAITTAINQLADAMQAKNNKGALSRAVRLIGDVTVVKIVFYHVNSLLEVFQVLIRAELPAGTEPQTRTQTLLAKILERLDTAEQRNVTSIDVVQVINMHVDQEHRSSLERHEAVVSQPKRSENASTSDNETAIIGTKPSELHDPANSEGNNAAGS